MSEIIDLIQNVGFPIAITIYLLYDKRREADRWRVVVGNIVKTIDQNTNALHELANTLTLHQRDD